MAAPSKIARSSSTAGQKRSAHVDTEKTSKKKKKSRQQVSEDEEHIVVDVPSDDSATKGTDTEPEEEPHAELGKPIQKLTQLFLY